MSFPTVSPPPSTRSALDLAVDRAAPAKAGGFTVGIDVSARAAHCVALSPTGWVEEVWLHDWEELSTLIVAVAQATTVAVDAPAELSTARHARDVTLSPKFRRARCAEIALGHDHRVWVPWVTPTEPPASDWISHGLELFRVLRAAGVDTIEVYPHAGFRVLGGSPIPSKRTAAGIAARAALLRRAGVAESTLEMWSHDGLDALMGAVIARGPRLAVCHEGESCDGSTIWLPALGVMQAASPAD